MCFFKLRNFPSQSFQLKFPPSNKKPWMDSFSIFYELKKGLTEVDFHEKLKKMVKINASLSKTNRKSAFFYFEGPKII